MPDAPHLLTVEHNLPWIIAPHIARVMLSDTLPPLHLCTSSAVLAFKNDDLLMTHLDRGWDIPGGHREVGEDPIDTAFREVSEETGAILDHIALLGHRHIRILGPCPDAYRYPYPESYQLFYWACVTDLPPFIPTTEARDRRLVPPVDAVNTTWVRENSELYAAARYQANTYGRYNY